MTMKTITQTKTTPATRNIQPVWMKPGAANASAAGAQGPSHSRKEYYCRDRATD